MSSVSAPEVITSSLHSSSSEYLGSGAGGNASCGPVLTALRFGMGTAPGGLESDVGGRFPLLLRFVEGTLLEPCDVGSPWIATAPGSESDDGGAFPFFLRSSMTNNLRTTQMQLKISVLWGSHFGFLFLLGYKYVVHIPEEQSDLQCVRVRVFVFISHVRVVLS